MNLADVFTVVFIILGFLIVFVAYWLAAAGLFPALVERCSMRLGTTPIKATLIGLVTWGPMLAIGSWISNHAPNGPGKFVGVLILITSALIALAGSAGLAFRVGSGLRSSRDEIEPWRIVLRGGIVLALTFVLPFVGTAVMLWSFLAGFGALVMGRPKARPVIVADPEPVVPAAISPAS
ncbi:MAG TPA: hypothetical protein VFG14_03645 [Chthoniobacteraceae bacterium]|nr:hypothetical protein [Chthoniobacteraceae bacterium]